MDGFERLPATAAVWAKSRAAANAEAGAIAGHNSSIQHHAARSDHYDFRLEIDGVLVSWAIPRGPSVNPQDRRMARRTEGPPDWKTPTFEG